MRLSHATRGTLGTVADLVSIGTLVYAGATLVVGASVEQAVLASFVCSLCVVLLGMVLRDDHRYGRRVRESNALPTFATAIETLSRATHALVDGGERRTFVVELEQALVHLAKTYSTVTGAPCVVTVKTTYEPAAGRAGDLAVKTVCRSEKRRPVNDAPAFDWVNENSDFRDVFDERFDYFFCNDLRAARVKANYRNSHFTDEVVRSGSYPYLSTIVWPVSGRSIAADERWDLIGFLCVDAGRSDAFEEPTDVAFGAAFASALYSGLCEYRGDREAAAATTGTGNAR